MIHEAYMPVYMGSRFLARDGRTEVVQEALADLKTPNEGVLLPLLGLIIADSAQTEYCSTFPC